MFKKSQKKPVSRIDELGPEAVAALMPCCCACLEEENADCRLKTLDRLTLQQLLQVALDLDFNLSLVVRALESRKLDATKQIAWKHEVRFCRAHGAVR